MDSHFLQSFVSVVELGSIAEAARQLDLSTATITQRLRVLEAELGNKLVVRSGRTVVPTVAGTRILERARVILRDVRDMESAATETDLPSGPLRLGATPTGLTGIVPVVLKQWIQAYPDISIFIEPASTSVLYARLLAGELDAAVIVHPQFVLPKTCNWCALRREKLVLVTPADMVVKDALDVVRREPYIRLDRQVIAGKMADDYLRRRGIRPRQRVELDGIETIARLVAQGLGVSVLPDWAALGPADSTVTRWTLPGPVPARTVGVMWQRSTIRAPLAEAFVALARQRFAIT
jgi:DNA-binding transcriptional LysR family regulator